jgi:hypothetical protein
MAEIGMLRTSWVLKIQLCWWHMRKAVWECLAKGKLSTTPYNVKCARTDFPFICLDFVPSGSANVTEYEGGNLDKTKAQPLPEDPNALHIWLTVPPSLHAPPPSAPPAVSNPQPIFSGCTGDNPNTQQTPEYTKDKYNVKIIKRKSLWRSHQPPR